MSTGVVKWFNDSKGFGFITPDDGSQELFAHYNEIQGIGHKTLTQGQRVEYRGDMASKGPIARAIRPL